MTDNETQEFTQKFPKLTQAVTGTSDLPLRAYREFERILAQIEATWGTLAGHEYLENLLMTQRTDRQGFSDGIASELIRLHLLHIQLYPERHHNPNDPFAQIR